MPEYRILITGSRDWTDRDLLCHKLGIIAGIALTTAEVVDAADIVIVHGSCPTGADRIADELAFRFGYGIERYPADWMQHGRAAGPIRNQQMVQAGADMCLAFIKDGSKGATGCADLAEAAGILTQRWITHA